MAILFFVILTAYITYSESLYDIVKIKIDSQKRQRGR
jgi:hypothetical protein